MFTSRVRCVARRTYAEMDYARHFPKEYVERIKRIVPLKIYDNRFGAPPIIRWSIPPEDYVPKSIRPWEIEFVQKTIERENYYRSRLLASKYFKKRINRINRIANEDWVFFPGDLVQVMVGKDKGRKGVISHVIRDTNAVFVDGLHTKLDVKEDISKALGLDNSMYAFDMQPLFVDKGQVELIDPNDNDPCTAKWVLNDAKTDYIRISERTGYAIPLPSQALMTYEYMTPNDYIEVAGKDTPQKIALKKTYEPKLFTFEEELENEYKLKPTGDYKPTYWY